MGDEKSQAPFLRTGQIPLAASETTVVDPTVDEKRFPPPTAQPNEPVPPPAYAEDAGGAAYEVPAAPAPSARPSHLRKPIAIPAIDAAFDSPFIRAYPPILREYNLPRESFLSFLDNLNQVVASSPPLQVLDAAGGILSNVPILFPLHWVGAVVSGVANLGSLGVSKSRTDHAIRQANKDIFGPRGLKVEIAKLDALAHVAGVPILDSKGKVNRQAALLQPLTMEANGEANSLDVQQRRLRALQPWIAELELDTLPWTSKSKLTRFNAALKKRQGYGQPDGRSLLAQHQSAADERQQKLAQASENCNRAMRELDNEEERARSRNGESETLARTLSSVAKQRSAIRAKYDADVARINEEYTAEDREEAGIRKILWLVIRDVEVDSGVRS